MTLTERMTQLTLAPEGEPIFSEQAFVIQIEDDAGGEYLSVQSNDEQCTNGQIRLSPEEWPALRDAIDRMVKECRG